MLIPIGDEPNEHRTPWVNWALIATNVLVFVLVQKSGRDEGIVERWAYVPSAPSLQTAFSSMFLHGDWMHLLGNMLFLWIFGDNVEARLGRLGYLAAYLATGLVATVVHGVSDPSSAVPSLGASGAISGVQGLYVVAFPRNRVKLLVWFYVVTIVYVKAAWVIGLWFVLNDLVPFLFDRTVLGGVAHGAHLGGFAAGLLLCLVLRPFLRASAPAAALVGARAAPPRPATRAPWVQTDPYGGGRTLSGGTRAPTDEVDVLGMWRAGRWEAAADGLSAMLREGRTPSLPETDFLRMALWLEERRRFADALQAFGAFLDVYPSSRSAGLAHFGRGILLSRFSHDAAAARPHLEAAARYTGDATVAAAAARELERIGS